MRVIAKQLGFFGKLHQPGDEFEVPDGTKGDWFEAVEKPVETGKAKAKPADKPADDLV